MAGDTNSRHHKVRVHMYSKTFKRFLQLRIYDGGVPENKFIFLYIWS